MNTIFINSKNSELDYYYVDYRLLLNLTDKINLKICDKYVAPSDLSIYYTWKKVKKWCKSNKFKISAPTWNEELNYLMDQILDQILKIILSISYKKNGEKTAKPSRGICINEIENRIKIKNFKLK